MDGTFGQLRNQPDLNEDDKQDSSGGISENNNNTNQTTPVVPAIEDIFESTEELELTISGSWTSGIGQALQLNVVIKNNGSTEENDWIRALVIKEGAKVTVSQC